MKKRNPSNSAFTILELVVTIVLVAVMTAPILNTFQVGDRLSERSRRSLVAQVLSREMIAEISKKSFADPEGLDTNSAALLPGPTHEEYDPNAANISNGVDETTLAKNQVNITLVDRRRYFDDIDDYDGYNTGENIFPTRSGGEEYLDTSGNNIYKDFRVKVKVVGDVKQIASTPLPLLNSPLSGSKFTKISATTDGRYIAALDPDAKKMTVIDLLNSVEVDCCGKTLPAGYGFGDTPNVSDRDGINLSHIRKIRRNQADIASTSGELLELGPPVKVELGPAADRFYVLHEAAKNSSGYGLPAAITCVDMNLNGTSTEVGFHKVEDIFRVPDTYFASLPANSIESIMMANRGWLYAAAGKEGLYRSSDGGRKWFPVVLDGFDRGTDKITHLAVNDNIFFVGGGTKLWALILENTASNMFGSPKILPANISAMNARGNGYFAIGTEDGKVFCGNDIDYALAQPPPLLPGSKKVNCILIDSSYRIWAGNDFGLYYSCDAFSKKSAAGWFEYLPADAPKLKITALHSDMSGTTAGPFLKVFTGNAASNPVDKIACQSLVSSGDSLYLFYLIFSGESPTGFKMISSSDGGRKWTTPVSVTSAQVMAAWSHSEIVDERGVIHVSWVSPQGSSNVIYYQRSADGGKTWLSNDQRIDIPGVSPIPSNYMSSLYSKPALYGSQKFRRVAHSPDNRVFVCYSEEQSSGAYHWIRYSPDGGINWPAQNMIKVKKTDGANELIESIDYIKSRKALLLTITYGTDFSYRKNVYIDPDLPNANPDKNIFLDNSSSGNNFSVPSVFNAEQKMIYQYLYKDKTQEGTDLVRQIFMDYPYLNKPENYYDAQYRANRKSKTALRPDILLQHRSFKVSNLYPPVFEKNRIYSFFAVDDFFQLRTKGTKAFLFNISDSAGAGYDKNPIFLDFMNGVNDSVATANHLGKAFFVKQVSDDSSDLENNQMTSGYSLKVASVGGEKIYVSADDRVIVIDPELTPEKAFSQYGFSGLIAEKLGCKGSLQLSDVVGAPDGNMVISSSNGIFLRNLVNTGQLISCSVEQLDIRQSVDKIDAASLPPSINTSVFLGQYWSTWPHYFKGLNIKSAHVLSGGLIFVVTAEDGIYRSDDCGGNWEKLESVARNAFDFSFAAAGSPEVLNKIKVFSRRPVYSGAKEYSELTLSVFDLRNGRLDSNCVLSRDSNPSSPSQAACFARSERVLLFNGNDRKFYRKSIAKQRKTAVNLDADSTLDHYSGFDSTGTETFEICFNGRYRFGDTDKILFAAQGAQGTIISAVEDVAKFPVGASQLKINSSAVCSSQYYRGKLAPGRLEFFIDGDSSSSGHLAADIFVDPEPEPLNIKMDGNEKIYSIIASPDGVNFFAFSGTSDNPRLFSICVPDNTGEASLKELNFGVYKPQKVIFSPKRADGSLQNFFVCDKNILDSTGNRLFDERALGGSVTIADAICTDAGDIIFLTSNRMLYKCVRASEKTVFVTVVDKSEGVAGAMPPYTVAKKFFSLNSFGVSRFASVPNRDYLKNNFIFVPPTYVPGQIHKVSVPDTWSSYTGVGNPQNVYVINGPVLIENGTLEIRAGTVVKFRTGNKKDLTADQYKKERVQSSCLIVGKGGGLKINGENIPSGKVLFTSVDDNSAAPSVYTAADLSGTASAGVPNAMIRIDKDYSPKNSLKPLDVSLENSRYGPWPGDWGRIEPGSYGGIVVFDSTQVDLSNLETRFGLLKTSQIYQGDRLPNNFNVPVSREKFNCTLSIGDWSATNIYVVDSKPALSCKAPSNLKIGPGVRVEIESGAALAFGDPELQRLTHPDFTLTCDGGPDANVLFTLNEESLTSSSASSARLKFDGLCDQARIVNAKFEGVTNIEFSGSNAYFTLCEFYNISGYKSKISFSDNDRTIMDNNQINLRPSGNLEFDSNASPLLLDNNINCRNNDIDAAGSGGYFIKSSQRASPTFYSNNVTSSSAGGSKGKFPGSKILLESSAYLIGNDLSNGERDSEMSCEINVCQKNSGAVVPVVRSNIFDNTAVALYFEGFDEGTKVLDGRISGNSFGAGCSIAAASGVSPVASISGEYSGAYPVASDYKGNIFFADRERKSVFKMNRFGDIVMRFGAAGSEPQSLSDPISVAVNITGEIFVLDKNNSGFGVKKYTSAGEYVPDFFCRRTASSEEPKSIAVVGGGSGETVLVSASGTNRILRFTKNGEYLEELGIDSPAGALEHFTRPSGLAGSPDGSYAFVTEAGDNNRLQKIKMETTIEDTNRFEITPCVFHSGSRDEFGFDACTRNEFGYICGLAEEGCYIELRIKAWNADRTLNESYGKTAKWPIKVSIDNTGGVVSWEGKGVAAKDSFSAAIDPSCFSDSGEARVYVRNTSATGELIVRVEEDPPTGADVSSAVIFGSVRVRWFAEIAPTGLCSCGSSKQGFKKYYCMNDPDVTVIKIPSSRFKMGDASLTASADKVDMSTYFIAETPATNAQINRWRESLRKAAPSSAINWDAVPGIPGYEDHPAVRLTWNDARNYTHWLFTGEHKDQYEVFLPTEAQYEKAMRGPYLMGVKNNPVNDSLNDVYTYPWGSSSPGPDICNYLNCGAAKMRPLQTVPVHGGTTAVFDTQFSAQEKKTYYGLRDICGNVFVWCRDYYTDPRSGGNLDPCVSSPSGSNFRAVRGGSWKNDTSTNCFKCSFRGYDDPAVSADDRGVRPCFRQ